MLIASEPSLGPLGGREMIVCAVYWYLRSEGSSLVIVEQQVRKSISNLIFKMKDMSGSNLCFFFFWLVLIFDLDSENFWQRSLFYVN